ncbi:DNA topoisomerase 3 [Pseudoalteromonas sp. Of11M-6]|uniref:DNA topoisomerase 3 n=1 Tax=Pseudoalteromonas sp. Of11M-6 TaxID=2917754 RepID=UPI001EF4E45D|nr:DNA topoisomerase 3 [Pseudoalteromonas sp. Of11M-6]MCG7556065.1 DNA topoisomerase 3 [Pseudoalteromonas sp. Of11M-6]
MRLFIAEKPELARAIVDGLGGGQNKAGYIVCGDDVVTWCFGHMLSLKDPEEYDERFSKWSMEDLPFSFIPWELKVTPDKKEQFDVIKSLLDKSTSCVNAGDTDSEGQLLVDEILKFVSYNKPVARVLINDNNLGPVKKALANLRDNTEFKGLSEAAEARSVGDQLYGYNLTRAYTITANKAGYQGVLSVGRVQTPVLGLIVRRDLEHESHSKSFYYNVTAQFKFGDIEFSSKLAVIESDPTDDKNRITDSKFAETLTSNLKQQEAKVTSVKTVNKTESPPLPYNLLKLQSDASRKFGLKPDQVKDITQTLREKHKLITYNRSDCQYLSEEHHAEANEVLHAVSQTIPALSRAVGAANLQLKSKAFNTSKVTAHHAIIPTMTVADLNALTQNEQKIYMLLARAYIAQFYPPYEFEQTDVVIECLQRSFVATSKVGKSLGWKVLYKNDQGNEEVETTGDAIAIALSSLSQDSMGVCTNAVTENKETKPPARYTIATLLNDLTRVAKYIRDPDLKASLIERDKGNNGEHGGIGTSATRDTIITNLFERGFIIEQGKSIVSTPTAREFYSLLPDIAKYPDMTAIWHEQQKEIEAGNMTCMEFIHSLNDFISGQIADVIKNGISGLNIKIYPCPQCKKPLRRLKGKNGAFWGCSGYEDGCKTALPDVNGQPQQRSVHTAASPSKIHKCTSCQGYLIRRSFKKKFFWGCENYPECSQSYPDLRGKPNYSKPKITEVK